MIADKLRVAILQAAISGQLTEQLPEDGTATDLLNQIAKEKTALVKDGKLKKQKPLPPVTEEEKPFNIPKNWEWVRISSIGSVVSGGTPKTSESSYWNGTVAWVTPADLGRLKDRYISNGLRSITEAGLAASSARLMPAGSVIMSSRAPIGYVAIALNALSTNQGCKSLVPTLPAMSEYIYYALLARSRALSEKGSGTTFKEVSGKVFASFLVPLPPFPEQGRIVAKLDKLMPLIDQLVELERERERI
ncbi:MAG: restriction endonuclease subunit S [Actinomycetaceae bacterium]|nr:restriction endonuclease subunit S [Actinomycetaceae bacterium]